MADRVHHDYPQDDAAFIALVVDAGTWVRAAQKIGCNPSTLRAQAVTRKLKPRIDKGLHARRVAERPAHTEPDPAGTPGPTTKYDYPADEVLVESIAQHGVAATARQVNCSASALRNQMHRRGLHAPIDDRKAELRAARTRQPLAAVSDDGSHPLAEATRRLLKKPHTVEELADTLDVAPKVVRTVLEELRADGFRVPETDEGTIVVEKVAPTHDNLHTDIDLRLLDGEHLRLGVISDTHLGSNEEALEHLNLAYDKFADEGITQVTHSGDWVDGLGIYRGHHNEVSKHTFKEQVDYAVEHYPRRDGIETLGISGNHDVEGDFGRIGANPVVAIANQRDDVTFLGDFSAMVQLPNEAWLHLLHGSGGMSYAYSYKAQKLVEGYPLGRKPAILVPGHWHVQGNFQVRGVQVMFPGCFQWRSSFMERKALQPAVGFHILDVRLAEDATIVEYTPRWYPFFEGRVVADGQVGQAQVAA